MDDRTKYPVRKALSFTAEQWQRVRAFRFRREIDAEAEAVRRLIDLGLEAAEKGEVRDEITKGTRSAGRA